MKNLRSISDFMKPEQISFSIFISRERILLAWVLVWILSPPNRVSSSESPILSNSTSVFTWSCIALLWTSGDQIHLVAGIVSLFAFTGQWYNSLTTTRFYRHWCTLISVTVLHIVHKPFPFNVLHFMLLWTEEEVDAVGISSPLPGLSWSSTRDSILLSVCELVDSLSSSTDVVLFLWRQRCIQENVRGDSDEDTLLGGDNIQTSTHASRIRSRLMKMLKVSSLWLHKVAE